MTRVNTLQTQAIIDFAASAYAHTGADAVTERPGASREAHVLSIAAGQETPANVPSKTTRGLEKLTEEYAGILKRIDALRVWAERGDTSGMRLC